VDAIKNRLNGGELTSDIPVPPYNAAAPKGWDGGETGVNRGESSKSISESSDKTPLASEFASETRLKSGDGENGEPSDFALTIFDHYKTMIEVRDAQLSAKDEQINALHAQIDKLTTALTERDTAAQEASERQINAVRAGTAEQLKAKDAQLSRMQDTVDSLTKQLADAAERERQLQETLDQRFEQSREQPRKWWMWWKH
jgi:hypothetical protein